MKQTLKITPKSKDEAVKIIFKLETRDLSSIKKFLSYFKNNKKIQLTPATLRKRQEKKKTNKFPVTKISEVYNIFHYTF